MNKKIKKSIVRPIVGLQVSLCLFAGACTKSIPEIAPQADEKIAAKNISSMKVLAAPPTPTTPIAPSADRVMVWNDEFNGSSIETNKWEILQKIKRTDPSGRDAWWLTKNAYVNGTGTLVIRTTKEPDGSYAGACIRTKGKFERAFGYYEARIRLAKQQGHWGAFWLFAESVNNVNGDGTDGTEIDVMEYPYAGRGTTQDQDKVQAALHYDGYGTFHHQTWETITGLNLNNDKFHTFGVEWTPTKYRFIYDGKLVWEETVFGGISKVPQHILISDEIGIWGGDIRLAALPDRMYVDYVRVYDKY